MDLEPVATNQYRNAAEKTLEVPRRTLTETLQEERSRLSSRVQEIDAVLAALEANPQVQAVLDLLQKTRCL